MTTDAIVKNFTVLCCCLTLEYTYFCIVGFRGSSTAAESYKLLKRKYIVLKLDANLVNHLFIKMSGV